MKSQLNSLLIAAGIALSAAGAYGQNKIVANVPFWFKTPVGFQPSGQYSVVPATSDGAVMKIQNVDTGKATMTALGTPASTGRENKPRLTFVCGSESGCTLTGMVDANGRGWTYKAPHLKPSENERVAVIYFDSKQAE